MNKKRITITMGDPGGVGPEIIVKALASERVREKIVPLLIGNRNIMEEAIGLTGTSLKLNLVEDSSVLLEHAVNLFDIAGPGDVKKGIPSAESGEISVKCIRKAVRMCTGREVDAMVTAPISKESVHRAGYLWPGHTEMLAELTGAANVGMMFAGESLNVILATIHVPLRTAVAMITEERVLDTIHLARKACTMLGIDSPRIGVAGLNPHAGEAGLFGTEETEHIRPAIEKALKEGIRVSGPFPPDVVFKKAVDGVFEMVVAMYHDQGLIPFKMLYFDTGVNVTVGLPIIRTSPDHGTAYDIAWKGIADPSSMIRAILLAERLKL